MDVRAAIAKAKEYFKEVFSDEDITEVGLEEIVFNEMKNRWEITIGYARTSFPMNRWYRVVAFDDSGAFQSITMRELAAP